MKTDSHGNFWNYKRKLDHNCTGQCCEPQFDMRSLASSCQENIKNFCRALLICVFSSGLLSGIISALCNALRCTSGLLSLTSCSPPLVTLRQKSTLTSVRLWPWSTTAWRRESVIREQFSRLRLRSILQLFSMLITSRSVMCPHPDRVSESRFGHLNQQHKKKNFVMLMDRNITCWFTICVDWTSELITNTSLLKVNVCIF